MSKKPDMTYPQVSLYPILEPKKGINDFIYEEYNTEMLYPIGLLLEFENIENSILKKNDEQIIYYEGNTIITRSKTGYTMFIHQFFDIQKFNKIIKRVKKLRECIHKNMDMNFIIGRIGADFYLNNNECCLIFYKSLELDYILEYDRIEKALNDWNYLHYLDNRMKFTINELTSNNVDKFWANIIEILNQSEK